MVSSPIGNIMDWYPCRQSKKHFFFDYDLHGIFLPWSWINNICNFAHEYGISLPNLTTQLDLYREGDLFLMEQLSYIGFTPTQLKKLNWYQLYLKIHSLSNIYNWHGKRYYNGNKYELYQSTQSWPDQGYPGPKELQLWCKVLRKFSPSDNTSTYLQKLGK